MTISFTEIGMLLLVFARVTAMIFFNPIFSRRNISNYIRMGLILVLTIVIAPNVENSVGTIDADLRFAVLLFIQIFIGFCLGFVFQIFYYLLFFVGDFLDVQFGLSMAKIFDPGTNIQMSVTGNFITIIFMLFIFVTDSHLTIIKIFAQTFTLIPIGGDILLPQVAEFMLNLFTTIFILGIKLILPFAMVEFIVEISMGILMKIIPQIHVFVINIQMKLFVGILLLLLFSNPLAGFIDTYVVLLLDQMQKVLIP